MAVYVKSFLENHQESSLLMIREMCVQITSDRFIPGIALFSPIHIIHVITTELPEDIYCDSQLVTT